MKKYISALLSLLLLSACSMNSHVKYVEDNHKNQWLEKDNVYRSLASVHEESEKINKKKPSNDSTKH